MTAWSFGAIAAGVLDATTRRKAARERGPDPVLRNSYDVDDVRAKPWRRFGDGSRAQWYAYADSLRLTLKELLVQQRQEGYREADRLQANDLLVFDAVIDHMNHETGEIFPELMTIAGEAGVSKQTVVDSLKRLWAHGFVRWVRRSRKTDNEGEAGPQRAQTSNAYYIDFSTMAKRTWHRFWQLVTRRLKKILGAAHELADDAVTVAEGVIFKGAELGNAIKSLEATVMRVSQENGHYPEQGV